MFNFKFVCSVFTVLFLLFFAVLEIDAQCDARIATPDINCNLVSFRPQNINAELSYQWDFGDGNTSNEISPTHPYQSIGNGTANFTATLTVSGPNCATNSSTVRVNVRQIPDASVEDIDVDRRSGEPLNFVHCRASENVLSIRNISSTTNTNSTYEINWGDPNDPAIFSGTEIPNPLSHEYSQEGEYTVTVTVRGQNGCVGEKKYNFFYGSTPNVGLINPSTAPQCAPRTFAFPVVGTESNSSGTRYEFIINDGSDPIVFNHPPPDTFFYTFNIESCETTANTETTTFSNSFQVTVLAINPCDSASATVAPIRINIPPIADFEIIPDDTPSQNGIEEIACQDEIFTFTNTSTPGLTNDGGECFDDMDVRWTIQPNDYNIQAGSTNEDVLSVDFTKDGFFDIILEVENFEDPACEPSTITKKICVVPIPEASFSLSNDNQFQCLGTTYTATNTSNTLGSCDTTLYTWEVTNLTSDCGAGQNVAPQIEGNNARFKFDSSGVYIIELTADNLCGDDTFADTVIISQAPNITIQPVDSIFCDDAEIQFEVADFSTCNNEEQDITFQWTFEGGTPSSHTGDTPPPVTFEYDGNGEIQTRIVTLTTNSDCGPATDRIEVKIAPSPDQPQLTTNAPICIGATLELGVQDTTGLRFEWTGPDGFTSNEAYPEIEDIGLEQAGTYTLTVINRASGCSNSNTIEVEIYELPKIQITPPEAEICIGQSQTFTASGGENYTWQEEGNTLNTTMGSTVIAMPDAEGIYEYTVIGVDENQCVSESTATLIVHPLPVVEAGNGTSVCVNTTFDLGSLTDVSPTTGGVGVWSDVEGNVSNNEFEANTPGIYTIKYTFTDENGCVASDSTQICVVAEPDANFSVDRTGGCVNDNIVVTATNLSTNLSDCADATYAWEVVLVNAECHEDSDVPTPNVVSDETATFTFTRSGEYLIQLTVSNPLCSETAVRSETIIIGDEPQIMLDSLSNLCEDADGNAIQFPSATVTACNQNDLTYQWTFNGAVSPTTSDQLDPGAITYNTANGTNYSIEFVATNGCGMTSDELNFEIFRDISADAEIPDFGCTPFELIPINNSSGSNLIFSWTVSLNGSVYATSTDSLPTFPLDDVGTYTVRLEVSNELCEGQAWEGTIVISEAPSFNLTDPDAPICAGGSINLDDLVTYNNEDLILSVLWTVEDAIPFEDSTAFRPGVIFFPENISGIKNIRLQAFNECDTLSENVTINVLAKPNALFGLESFVCKPLGGEITIVPTDSSGGDNRAYLWEVFDNEGNTATNVDIAEPDVATPNITFSATGTYTVQLTLSNDGGCDPSVFSREVTISEAPDFQFNELGIICRDTSINLDDFIRYDNEGEGLDAFWVIPGRDTIRSLRPGEIDFPAGEFEEIEIEITVFNDCETITETQTLTLYEPLIANFELEEVVCQPISVFPTNNSSGTDPQYEWSIMTIDGAEVSSSNVRFDDAQAETPQITFNRSGIYVITLAISNEICGSSTHSDTIDVSESPSLTLLPFETICARQSFNIANFISYTIDTNLVESITWDFGLATPATSNFFLPSSIRYPDNVTGPQTISVNMENRCGTFDTTATLMINEELIPRFNIVDFACIEDVIMVEDSSSGTDRAYLWTVLDENDNEVGTNVVTITNATTANPTFAFSAIGTYTIRLQLTNAVCTADPLEKVIEISEPPQVILDPFTTICSGSPFILGVNYPNEPLIESFLWFFQDAQVETSTDARPNDIIYHPDTTGRKLVRVSAFNQCGVAQDSQFLDILEPIIADARLDTLFGCLPDFELGVTNLSTGDSLNYKWSVVLNGDTLLRSNELNPSFTLSEIGTYEVILEVFNNVCIGAFWSDSIEISELPKVALDPFDPICSGSPFTLGVAYPNEDLIESYLWFFQDAQVDTSTAARPDNIIYHPDTTGRKLVRVSAFNQCGMAQDSQFLDILEPIIADARLDTLFGCLPDFELGVTNLSTGDSLNYKWSVVLNGDTLLRSNELNPSFTLSEIGTYEVILEVFNNVCIGAFWSDSIEISELPKVALDPFDPICSGSPFALGVNYPNEPLIESFLWFFQDAQVDTSTAARPDNIIYHPDTTGRKLVRVSAFNQCGVAQDSQFLDILEPIIADARLDTLFGCLPDFELSVTNLSTGDSLNYKWSVVLNGDTLLRSSDENPTFTLSEIGTYEVILEVFNNVCVGAFWSDSIEISELPKVELDPFDPICSGSPFTLGVNYPNEPLIESFLWFFQDAQVETSTDARPDNIVYHPDTTGRKLVRVSAFNRCGVAQDSQFLDILEPIIANAQLDTLFGCLPDFELGVTNLSTGDSLNYRWSVVLNGDTISRASEANPTFTLSEIGTYEIILEVFNSVCVGAFWSDSIEISELPEVALDPFDPICSGSPFTLGVNYPNEPLIESFLWFFQDAQVETSTDARPDDIVYHPDTTGRKLVRVSAFNRCGVAQDSQFLDILEPIVANAELDTLFGCLPDFELGVTNLSTGDSLNYKWSVVLNGDTILRASDENPTFTLSEIGTYEIILEVFNSVCVGAFWSDSIEISELPEVMLDPFDPICSGSPFTLGVNYPNEPLIESFLWFFQDAQVETSTAARPDDIVYHPDTTGRKLIRISTFNRCGVAQDSQFLDILEPIVANAELDTLFGCLPDFELGVTNLSTGDSLNYRWSVVLNGDTLTQSSEANPSFTLQEIGTYEIILEVFNSVCVGAFWSDSIEISELPEVELDPFDPICSGSPFTLGVNYPNEPLIESFLWFFQDAQVETSTDARPDDIVYHPDTTGRKLVRVSAFNRCGVAQDSQFLDILEPIIANAQLDTLFGCLPDFEFGVTNLSTGDSLNYRWSVVLNGDTLTQSSEANPSFTLSEIGTYEIILEVFNSVCVGAFWSDSIEISELPEVILDPFAPICSGSPFTLGVNYPNEPLIESFLWFFEDAQVDTSTAARPDDIVYHPDTTGRKLVRISTFNRCGISQDSQFLDILEPIVANAELDTLFGCLPDFELGVTNLSTGDSLNYRWSVVLNGDTLTQSSEVNPSFTLQEIGTYEIILEVFNSVCEGAFWSDSIEISELPEVVLDPFDPICSGSPFTLGVNYPNEPLIESFLWFFQDAQVETSTDFRPDDIVYHPDTTGRKLVRVSAFNRCGVAQDSQFLDILEPIVAAGNLADNFGCLPDFETTVVNLSSGDSLLFELTITPSNGVTISDNTAREPMLTFTQTGTYTATQQVFNEVCGTSSWADTIQISEKPMLTLDSIPDFCDGGTVTPQPQYANLELIDSVRWTFSGADVLTSTDSFPMNIPYSDTIGDFTICVTAYNGCDSTQVCDTFTILESMQANATIDTFACLNINPTLTATSLSTGDRLSYEWTITPNATISNPNDSITDITFSTIGSYIIQLRVFNEVCGESIWQDTIFISDIPVIDIQPIPDFCQEALFTPVANFNLDTLLYNSILWEFMGGQPATSSFFAAEPIFYSQGGDYIVRATVENRCGSDMAEQAFRIDTIPEIILGLPDTICLLDGIHLLDPPIPSGGVWSGDCIDDPIAGTVDPGPPGSGTREEILTYTVTNGECLASKEGTIYKIDLSNVDAGEPLSTCISEERIPLTSGFPAGGRYEGQGVRREDGNYFFYPNTLVVGDYIIQYIYEENNCVGMDSLIATVHPLPIPMMTGVDSLCVDVPERLVNISTGATSYEWFVTPPGRFYATTSPTHIFDTVGFHDIQLIATSEFGCVDSITQEVFVSGPPDAFFEMDTTMGCAVLPIIFTNLSIGYRYITYGWDFGNGDTSSLEQPPRPILYEQGLRDTTYYIELFAQNVCGADTHIDSVLVFPKPLPAIDVSQPIGCTPLTVELNNFSEGLPDEFLWKIIHRGVVIRTYTDSIPPAQVFEALDTMNEIYTIRLITTNECGIDSTEKRVIVQPDVLRAFFSVDAVSGCTPMTVDVTNTTTPDTAVVYSWFAVDVASNEVVLTSNAVDTSFTLSATDTTAFYDIILVANNGCAEDSMSLRIRVEPAPEISFSRDNYACARDSTRFINTSKDEVVGFIWDFGDGDSSRLTNPWHIYQNTGTYTVNMTAFDAKTGCPNTTTDSIFVRDIPKPFFRFEDNFGCPPLAVPFTNLTTGADFYTWDMGDGNTKVGRDIGTHTYRETGSYIITLIATDEFGCSGDTTLGTVEVYPVPVAQFEVPMQDTCGVPQTLCISNTSTGADGFDWYYDGSFATDENNPCVEYTRPDTYNIELIAKNEFLCADTIEQSFRIFGEPMADFNPMDTVVCQGDVAIFENFSVNYDDLQWVLNGQLIDAETNLNYIFQDTGTYSLSLYIQNDLGCRDSLVLEENIYVSPRPTAAFSYEFLDAEPLNTYQFFDRSSEDAILFWWNFGDGDTSALKDPRHRYISSTDKLVTHVATNAFGCTDTTQQIIDLDTLGYLYVPNILEPENRVSDQKRVFLPKGVGLDTFHIAIFARNGQLVWESTALDEDGRPTEAWDGNYRSSALFDGKSTLINPSGQQLPSGTYVWKVLTARFIGGRDWDGMADEDQVKRRSGFLYLVR